MKVKFLISVLSFLLLCILFSAAPPNTYAQTTCSMEVTNVSPFTAADGITHLVAQVRAVNVTIDGLLQTSNADNEFYINVPNGCNAPLGCRSYIPRLTLQDGEYTDELRTDKPNNNILFPDITKEYTIQIVRDWGLFSNHTVICSTTVSYDSNGPPSPQCKNFLIQSPNFLLPPIIERGVPFSVTVAGTDPILYNQTVYLRIFKAEANGTITEVTANAGIDLNNLGSGNATFVIEQSVDNGNYTAALTRGPDDPLSASCVETRAVEIRGATCLKPSTPCTQCPDPNGIPICSPYICVAGCVGLPQPSTFEYICTGINNGVSECLECENFIDGTQDCHTSPPQKAASCDAACGREITFEGYCGDAAGNKGISTAIGCIPFTLVEDTTKFFLAWGISVGGGFALLMLAYGSFIIATSSGDIYKLKNGKDILYSAIAGLILITFSAFLLRTIGVDILQLFS